MASMSAPDMKVLPNFLHILIILLFRYLLVISSGVIRGLGLSMY